MAGGRTIHRWKFLLSVIAFILEWVSLYQLEIAWIAAVEWGSFCFPFYIYCTSNIYLVRDFFYSVNFIAFLMLLYALWRWG